MNAEQGILGIRFMLFSSIRICNPKLGSFCTKSSISSLPPVARALCRITCPPFLLPDLGSVDLDQFDGQTLGELLRHYLQELPCPVIHPATYSELLYIVQGKCLLFPFYHFKSFMFQSSVVSHFSGNKGKAA